MKSKKKQITSLIIASLLLMGSVVLTGCKKESPPPPPAETAPAASAATEQTTCPVMGGAINKDIFVEYKGKKVYFCCAGCEEMFKADPDKYIAKLPQFKD